MPRAKKADTGIKYPYIEVTKLVHNGVVHTHRQRIYSEKTERKGYRILLEKISQIKAREAEAIAAASQVDDNVPVVSQPEDIAASQVDERHESSMDIVPALAQSEADMAQPVYDDYDALYYHDDGDYPPDDDYGHSNSDPSNEACPPDDPSNEVGVGLPEQPPEPQVDPEQVNQEGRESNASESESNAAGPTDTATPSAPTGQCRHAQVITVTEGQKFKKSFRSLLANLKTPIVQPAAKCNSCPLDETFGVDIYKCADCAVNYCDDCWGNAHKGHSQLHCAWKFVKGQVLGRPIAPPVTPIFNDFVHAERGWSDCRVCMQNVELLTLKQGRIQIQMELCSNKGHRVEAFMSNGFIPTSTYQMEKAVTEEVLLNFEAFFAHTKCSGNDFQWAVKSTSFLTNSKQCDAKAIYAAHNVYMYLKWEEKKLIQGPFAEDWCPACPNKITLEWPQRHGELAFGAAVNLLERLDSVNDIEEKALREDYTSVLKAIKVADSFFYNPGTGPIELPFQFAFDACLRIKHKKRKSKKSNKKPCNESQAICPAPYLKQVPESAVQINNTEQTCSDFLANFQYPQSKNSDQFDRRAVAGSVCSRHGVPIPRTFSNVYCGEAYAYCDSAVESIVEYFKGTSMKFVLHYDIACQYEKNITNDQRLPTLDKNNIKFAVPTFHLYAHKLNCHLNYASKAIPNTGDTVGEMTETLWSVLGGYGTIFRAFRLSRQVDYLNLVLREYAKCTADSLLDRITGKIKNYSLKLDVVKLSLSQSVEILKAKDPELGSKFGQRLTVPDCTPVFTIIMKKLKSPGNPDTAVTPYEEALVEHYRAQDEATKRRTLLRVECIEAETAGCIRVAEDSNEYSQIHKRYCARKLEIAAEDLLTKQVGYKKVYDRKEKEDRGQQPSKMFDDAMRERKAKIDNSLKAYNALLEGIKGKGFFEEYAEFQYHAKLHEDILKRHNFSGISSEEMTFVDCLHSYQRMLEENHFLYQEIRNIILYHRHRLNYAMDSCKKRVRGCKLEPLQIRWLDTAFLELVVILKKVGPLLAVMQQGASE